jgi:thiamine-phosphate pyrophosphorylase
MYYISPEMKDTFCLILISPETYRADEAAIVSDLFKSGLDIYHLRKPHWTIDETECFLRTLPEELHSRVVLHDCFTLTHKFKVKGIHLNAANRKQKADHDKYKIISTSFHSLHELRENTFQYEYVFLSPIFDSISKPGYGSQFDLQLLAQEMQAMKKANQLLPAVVALGGINEKNISLVKSAGFPGAAMIGAIWLSEDPVKEFQKIKSTVAQL